MDSLFRDIEKFDRMAVVPKKWGYEVWHFNTPTLCMKTLIIYPGHTCSFHWHEIKYEVFTCLDSSDAGQLFITVGSQPERLLQRGEHVIIQPGVEHSFRVHGKKPGALLELSTHHREGDSYRVWSSQEYGGGSMAFMGKVAELKDRKVLFVGDLALDEYTSGSATRLSPEAPVPVVDVDPYAPDIRQMPGCVGNALVSCQALGGKCALVGLIGDDRAGEDLRHLLEEMTVETSYLLTSELRPTIKKNRIFAGTHYVTRVDREDSSDYTDDMEKVTIQQIIMALDEFKPEIVYIADYDKGMMTKEVISHTVAYSHERGIPVIADPKIRHFHLYDDVDILKPNDVRASEAMGMEAKSISEVEQLATAIVDKLQLKGIVLTRGANGVYVRDNTGKDEHIPAVPVPIAELSGAGDTFGACFTLAVASGMCTFKAARLANVAASVVVQKTGTAFCTPSELCEALAQQ
ncbi:MAG: PfkB family carbohydrate kinase [Candidatus Thorarchaeota archaeon]|jgi:rfaE bifunctional protein kinase chain/domain